MTELVIMHDQQAVTTSLQVAEDFGKRHDNVLRDIETLKKDVLNFEEMFSEGDIPDSYGRSRKTYYMNRDGFTLLAMGFTGKEALRFKLKYIEAFNKMEEQQKQVPQMSQAELIVMMAQQHVDAERRLLAVEEKTNEQSEKIDNITNILSLTVSDWRNETNRIINAISMKLGGGQYFKEIRKESYELLDRKASSDVRRRLQNRKEKAALRGQSKTEISKMSVLDVIGDDKKLISVYVTVIKELAVKYQLNLSEYQLIAEVSKNE